MTPPNKDVPPIDLTIEQDDRFPSGTWIGFFLQPGSTAKGWMELILTFRNGKLQGEGRDRVGKFLINGAYDVKDGKCHWHKSYIGKHSLMYQGFNEGKGIWGLWEYEAAWKGGFHIWPEAMGDPTQQRLAQEIDEPIASDFVGSEIEEEAYVSVGR